MDTIRAEKTRYAIHEKANAQMRSNRLDEAEQTYRNALRIYPNKPGMILGLASVLALKDRSEEAVMLIEKGLPLSINEKQKATMRAALCFLYLKCGRGEKAEQLAFELPHKRECREAIVPVIMQKPCKEDVDRQIQEILLGEERR